MATELPPKPCEAPAKNTDFPLVAISASEAKERITSNPHLRQLKVVVRDDKKAVNPTFSLEISRVADAAKPEDVQAIFAAADCLLRTEMQTAAVTTNYEVYSEYKRMWDQLVRIMYDPHLSTLNLDFFAVTQFSNLYRDAAKDPSYFSKSRSFIFVELHRALGRRHERTGIPWGEVYGIIGSQTASAAPNSTGVNAATGSFSGELGVVYWIPQVDAPTPFEVPPEVGVFGGGGWLAFPPGLDQSNSSTGSADEFHTMFHVGLVARETVGPWRGTTLEVAYKRDPRFTMSNRFVTVLRGVISPGLLGTTGNLGGYVEMAISTAFKGRDEARLAAGVRVNATDVLKAIFGGGGGTK